MRLPQDSVWSENKRGEGVQAESQKQVFKRRAKEA